jgi:hypothetical protein
MQKPRSEEKKCCVCGRLVKKEEAIDLPDEGTYCVSCYEQKYSAETAQPSVAGPQFDIFDEIEKLGKLEEKGLITNEEFETKKKELLKRL